MNLLDEYVALRTKLAEIDEILGKLRSRLEQLEFLHKEGMRREAMRGWGEDA